MIDFVCVGKKITECRKKKKMTQDDLAEKLFVSRQLISKWELGTGIPSIDVLLELSFMFEISIEELLCLEQKIEINIEDIFKNHDRLFIVNSLINNKLDVSLEQIFSQLSPSERMMVLRGIKEGRTKANLYLLRDYLTSSEIKYMELEIKNI